MGAARLTRRSEFLACAAAGGKAALPGMVVQALPHPAAEPRAASRIGFTVTRKVGNSVVRNRVRRRLREVARLALAERPVLGHDLVLIGRQATIGRDFRLLREDLDRALARLGARPADAP